MRRQERTRSAAIDAPGEHRRRRAGAAGWVAAGALSIAVCTGGGLLAGDWRWPDRWNPWAPLDLGQPLDPFTAFKAERAGADRDGCRLALATSGWPVERVADTRPAAACGLHDAVRVTPRAAGRPLTEPLLLSCPAALALALWQRHAVEPAAEAHLGAPLVRIETLGSYACRDIDGRPGSRSRHASADALDVSAFVVRGGRRITVARGWPGTAGADSAFLHAVHAGACRWFDGVLGPDYNRAHADHFHLERGPYGFCR